MNSFYIQLLAETEALIDEKEPCLTGLANACALLYQRLGHVNWVGFYMVCGSELTLGPFQGKPACTRIGKGRGVCGHAWETGRVVRVKNVHDFPGHIACDAASRSEIVLPLFCQGRVVAVLDIDSPLENRFSQEDEEGLEQIARRLEQKIYGFWNQTRTQEERNAPIGVMDSGVGGISVLREMRRMMPAEDYIYYGDSLHAPYGTRTVEEVQRFSFHSASFLIEHGVKALVVACNTATSAAIARLRERFVSMPIIGIEPALKPAAVGHGGEKILVMATPMTLREDKFHVLMEHYGKEARVIPISCEGLMEYVEQGITEGKELEDYLMKKLQDDLPADSIVLGCTHYPFIKKTLRKLVGERPRILDGGEGTAREVRRRLLEEGLLRQDEREGTVMFYNSLPSQEILERSRRLLTDGD